MKKVLSQKILLLMGLLLIAVSVLANTSDKKGNLKGKVFTADNQPAGFVNVVLKGTNRYAVSKEDGSFAISNISVGKYLLEVSFVGYKTVKKNITISENQTNNEEIRLEITDNQLNEVIVKASKTYKLGKVSESLRLQSSIIEAPQNIQVVTKSVIANQQIFDMLEGVTRNVSGAQRVEHWDNYARINTRGSNATAFRNGMNVQMPWGPLTEDMSIVDKIEFVKGPAGFMLANGEPAGIYNIVTKKPTGNQRGEATMTLGSFDTYRSTIDLDGKLDKSGKLLYRLNLMGQMKGSHRNYEYNNRYTIAPVLKYLFDDQTSLTLEYNLQYSQMSMIGSNYSFSPKGYADLPVNHTTAESNLEPTRIYDNSLTATLQHELNDRWTVTGQLAYMNYSQEGQSMWPWSVASNGDMQRGISIWDALGVNKIGQLYINGQEKTGAVTHKFLAGLDMKLQDYYADWSQGKALGGLFNVYNPVYGTISSTDIPTWDRTKSIRERGVRYNTGSSSLYVQDELGFLDNKVRLTLAGRYTRATNINPYSGQTEDKKFTPRVGLSISLDKNSSVYAVLDQVFLPNYGSDYQGKEFDPVTGNNQEIGFKRDWMEGKWNTSLALYRIVKNNVLVTDTEHPDPTSGEFRYLTQVGQTQTKGLEFDIRGEILRNLELVLNYSYTDGEITKDTNPDNIGNKLAGSTKHLNNAWLNYRFSNGKLNGLGLSLGYQYQVDRSSWYVFDNSEQSLPDYFRLDGGVSWQNNKFSVNLTINNLLNKYLYSGGPYYGYYYWQSEPLRNSRITIGYKF